MKNSVDKFWEFHKTIVSVVLGSYWAGHFVEMVNEDKQLSILPTLSHSSNIIMRVNILYGQR